MCILNLREDYAIGLIAQSCKVDKEVTIDDDSLLELEDKFNPTQELSMCFKEASNFHEVDDEVFEEVQASISLEAQLCHIILRRP